MTTWELHITGQVQGVGFRPHVYQLAHRHGLRGVVRNGNDGVRVRFNGTPPEAKAFKEQLLVHPPRLARISATNLQIVEGQKFPDFQIVASNDEQVASLLISPDFGICPDCRVELHTPGNRRHQYPFNTCTNCGPRYSIMQALPYDRPRTTMHPFTMCANCANEYNAPADRRHFSQTNSCPSCAVSLTVLGDEAERSQEDILAEIISKWDAGAIVALKGIGGFLLTCPAEDEAAIARLRQRKHRPDKPLALMYPTLAEVERNFHVSAAEAAELESPVAPIVLLRPRNANDFPGVAPGLDRVGVMLPYAPLFERLLAAFGRPVVATSGNRSGEPIVYQDALAETALADLADLIIGNDREIVTPQDDSVVTLTPGGRRIILRRSRGLAPTFFTKGGGLAILKQDVFAAGADLKSTCCFQHGEHCYLSQYLGDQDSFVAQTHYRRTRDHLQQMLGARPQRILTDLHPGYSVTAMAHAMATELRVPLTSIQHHEAHFAAVLGENDLLIQDRPILGVIWDGTGLGADGQLWGGEFFRFENAAFSRVDHLPYLPVLAGDKMAREPRLSALALAGNDPEAATQLQTKFTPTAWAYYQKARQKPALYTSSMGRLFDAVACLLGLGDTQSYEGMVAARLEALARSAPDQEAWPLDLGKALLPALLSDLRTCGRAQTAFRFHLRLVHLIRQTAEAQKVQDLAFSGGVFQNTLLVELIEKHLSADYHLYFHEQLAPNDENIAFGQVIHHAISAQRTAQKQDNHVLSNTR